MKEIARSAAWRLMIDTERTKVVVVFEGRLSAAEARSSAEAFAELLSTGRFDVVWDIRGMSGYDVLAPLAWQRAMTPKRKHVRSLGVRGGNSFVRLGATALAAALGIPLHDVDG